MQCSSHFLSNSWRKEKEEKRKGKEKEKKRREKRGSGQRRKVLLTTPIPTNWRSFLRVDDKTELFRLLVEQADDTTYGRR